MMESLLVSFILSARAEARSGTPRTAEVVREFAFVPMGVPALLSQAGLDPNKIVDEVWNICEIPGGTGE
jgi:hypothetical protein